ncbi:uncharacterized protein LOC126669264 isoform X2 [Mercurialis annua]|uniref:uncharacterized protein LOC126669264 isoform X2 n=1 Tax=Mercurialis annua TaxID=3986 RepID=UPI00215DE5D4|nr:uncharacterized protein LOC126669264 isoform X2 [Mercurialis annua]
MEQSSSISHVWSNDETEVASILLQLPHLINHRDTLLPFSSWGVKRKRSVYESLSHRRASSSSPPSPPPPPAAEKIAVKCEATTTSPDTPLAFCPSESDEKSKRLKRKSSVKKTKEELVAIIEDCNQSKELLKKKIEKSQQLHDQLKAENLALKARKQEGHIREKSQAETETGARLTVEVKTEVDQRRSAETGETYQNPRGKRMSWFPGMAKMISIPDLNVYPGESYMMMEFSQQRVDDFNKARAHAAARQRRMQICRQKNSHR